MRHALEADHVAAVASLATRGRSVRDIVRLGATWGLGHTLTLFAVGSAVLILGAQLPENIAAMLELAVGIMLVALGADVLRRIVRDRIHFHAHRHDGDVHLHAHSHADEATRAASAHDHAHRSSLSFRALLVGAMHGMAGSAALVLLTLGTLQSIWLGMLYMALFGLGSMAGMAVLSLAISVPLRFAARRLTWAYNGLSLAVGVTTIGLGATIIYRIAGELSAVA